MPQFVPQLLPLLLTLRLSAPTTAVSADDSRGLAGSRTIAHAAQEHFKVGDRIQAYNVGWYDATITRIGAGSNAGEYMVRYDKYASEQWIAAKNIRARPGADKSPANTNASSARSAGPRLGRYVILSYGRAGAAPLRLGEVELLAGGRYRVSLPGGRANGEGRYDFDAAAGTVRWLSGRYKDEAWGGGFTVEREGKTHTIRLKSGTVAVNSTDG